MQPVYPIRAAAHGVEIASSLAAIDHTAYPRLIHQLSLHDLHQRRPPSAIDGAAIEETARGAPPTLTVLLNAPGAGR